MTALLNDLTAAFDDRFHASTYWETAAGFGATHVSLLISMINVLYKQEEKPTNRTHVVRTALTAGTTRAIWREFEQRFGLTIIELYGMTECGWHDADEPTRGDPRRLGRHAARVRRSRGRRRHRSPRRAERTRRARGPPPSPVHDVPRLPPKARGNEIRAWQNLWFHTGDYVTRDGDGYYYFVDRKKDVLPRRRGENLAPYDVESVLNRHPCVFESVVVGVPSPLGEEDVKAFIQLAPGDHRLRPGDLRVLRTSNSRSSWSPGTSSSSPRSRRPRIRRPSATCLGSGKAVRSTTEKRSGSLSDEPSRGRRARCGAGHERHYFLPFTSSLRLEPAIERAVGPARVGVPPVRASASSGTARGAGGFERPRRFRPRATLSVRPDGTPRGCRGPRCGRPNVTCVRSHVGPGAPPTGFVRRESECCSRGEGWGSWRSRRSLRKRLRTHVRSQHRGPAAEGTMTDADLLLDLPDPQFGSGVVGVCDVCGKRQAVIVLSKERFKLCVIDFLNKSWNGSTATPGAPLPLYRSERVWFPTSAVEAERAPAILLTPTKIVRHPGVLVTPEVFGLDDLGARWGDPPRPRGLRGAASRSRPDQHRRTFGSRLLPLGRARRGRGFGDSPPVTRLTELYEDALAFLRSAPMADPDKTALVGLSYGASPCDGARRPRPEALRPRSRLPGAGPTRRTHAAHHRSHAHRGRSTRRARARARRQLEEGRTDGLLTVVEAGDVGHNFLARDLRAYRLENAEAAWTQMIDFLKSRLFPPPPKPPQPPSAPKAAIPPTSQSRRVPGGRGSEDRAPPNAGRRPNSLGLGTNSALDRLALRHLPGAAVRLRSTRRSPDPSSVRGGRRRPSVEAEGPDGTWDPRCRAPESPIPRARRRGR